MNVATLYYIHYTKNDIAMFLSLQRQNSTKAILKQNVAFSDHKQSSKRYFRNCPQRNSSQILLGNALRTKNPTCLWLWWLLPTPQTDLCGTHHHQLWLHRESAELAHSQQNLTPLVCPSAPTGRRIQAFCWVHFLVYFVLSMHLFCLSLVFFCSSTLFYWQYFPKQKQFPDLF